jgi:hypothetical protein
MSLLEGQNSLRRPLNVHSFSLLFALITFINHCMFGNYVWTLSSLFLLPFIIVIPVGTFIVLDTLLLIHLRLPSLYYSCAQVKFKRISHILAITSREWKSRLKCHKHATIMFSKINGKK